MLFSIKKVAKLKHLRLKNIATKDKQQKKIETNFCKCSHIEG